MAENYIDVFLQILLKLEFYRLHTGYDKSPFYFPKEVFKQIKLPQIRFFPWEPDIVKMLDKINQF